MQQIKISKVWVDEANVYAETADGQMLEILIKIILLVELFLDLHHLRIWGNLTDYIGNS